MIKSSQENLQAWESFHRDFEESKEKDKIIGYLLQPLEDTIRQKFLTSLTGQNSFNDVTRQLMALPVRLGGLGITNPSTDASSQYESSMMIAYSSHYGTIPRVF